MRYQYSNYIAEHKRNNNTVYHDHLIPKHFADNLDYTKLNQNHINNINRHIKPNIDRNINSDNVNITHIIAHNDGIHIRYHHYHIIANNIRNHNHNTKHITIVHRNVLGHIITIHNTHIVGHHIDECNQLDHNFSHVVTLHVSDVIANNVSNNKHYCNFIANVDSYIDRHNHRHHDTSAS